MKHFKQQLLLLTGIIFFNTGAFAQKPAIDTNVFGKWSSSALPPFISNDGKYLSCYDSDKGTTSIRLVRGSSVKQIGVVTFYGFSQDNRKYVFQRNDSLGIGELNSPEIKWISGIITARLLDKGKADNWMIYQKNENTGTLVVKDLQSGKEASFQHVSNY